jgi:clan AA aspartic protease (TIGR02281 family)
MVVWALRYLVVAVVVGVGFAMLQGSDWMERLAPHQPSKASIAPKPRPAETKRAAAPDTEGDQGEEYAGEGDQGEESVGEGDQGEESLDEGDQGEESVSEGDQGEEYVVQAGPNGHFVVDAVVNGSPVTFLVDTGASDIVLTQADARRLGFVPGSLDFSEKYQTANGAVRGAPVRLRELRIGGFSLYNLKASVNEGPLPVSLLGMSFLEQLRGYQVEDGRLILHW